MGTGSVVALALAAAMALHGVAGAQPLSEDPRRDSRRDPRRDPRGPEASPSPSTTMPVPIEDGTETMTETMGRERSERPYDAAAISLEKPIDPATYLCGPGDVFELNFWGRQNFRLQIAADLEGNAFIAKIGFVNVAGKSLTAVRALVKKKVQREYPGLGFELTLTKPRMFLVHLVDNVKTPGAYAASALDRVATTLKYAGGSTGSRRRIVIKRASGAELTADLVLYELTGDTSYNPYVLDGDVITVPFPELTVSIAGPVHRPGPYELVKSKDLAELLHLAGGLKAAAARTLPIRIVRRNERQQQTFHDVPFTGAGIPNHSLRDDDEIYVQSVVELQRSVLLIGAVVGADPLDQTTTSKRLLFVQGDTVRSLIERAGGIRAPGDLDRSYISRPRKSEDPLVIPINLEALLVQRDFSADRAIEIGDSIVIPPMRYAILVEGAVGRPGAYTFNPQFGVPEYIAHAGGRTRTARDEDEIKLVSISGAMRSYERGTKLQPGEAILVPERNFTRPEVVQIVIATAGLLLSGLAITIAVTR